MSNKIRCLAAGMSLALLLPFGAQAATVTLTGTDVVYEYDTVTNAAALAQFGTPTIIGNSVRFLSPSFRAESTNGAGLVEESATFVFDSVYGVGGEKIKSVGVIEFGDYRIDTAGDVAVDLELTVDSNTSADSASATADFDASGDSGGKQTWNLTAQVNPASEFTTPSDDVAVTLENILAASTDNTGDVAWAQKKITLVTAQLVPLPAAAWLFGSSLVGLVLMGRRRAAKCD